MSENPKNALVVRDEVTGVVSGGRRNVLGVRWNRRLRRFSGVVAAGILASMALAACGDNGSSTMDSGAGNGDGKTTLGFVQVGPETGWRAANTKSIQDAARDAGLELKFESADQKQDVQIAAIRSYIKAKVDIIAFSPVVPTGWETVLGEAKKAKIPVVITDRNIDTREKSLYASFIGPDYLLEGKRAGDWLVREYANNPNPVTIVELEGSTGSAPQIGRRDGFSGAIAADPKFKIIDQKYADLTRERGKTAMAAILSKNPQFDVLYSQSDDMTLGAMEALKEAGKRPGVDVKIISVDAIRDGMMALAEGQINFIVECTPLFGPQLMDLVKKIKRGETVPTTVVTEEATFTPDHAKNVLPSRKY